MYILKKRVRKLKNMTFLHFMTIFHNFAFKIETGRAKRVVKPILGTRNVNDVCMHVGFIHSRMENLKR